MDTEACLCSICNYLHYILFLLTDDIIRAHGSSTANGLIQANIIVISLSLGLIRYPSSRSPSRSLPAQDHWARANAPGTDAAASTARHTACPACERAHVRRTVPGEQIWRPSLPIYCRDSGYRLRLACHLHRRPHQTPFRPCNTPIRDCSPAACRR